MDSTPYTDTTPIQAQLKVLEWAHYAESYTKLGFFKEFCLSFGMEEIHHAKNMLGNILTKPNNRKKKWIGPNPTKEKKEQESKKIEKDQDVPTPDSTLLPRPFVSRHEVETEPWWHAYAKSDVVGYDAEHVHLNKGTSHCALMLKF